MGGGSNEALEIGKEVGVEEGKGFVAPYKAMVIRMNS